MLINTSAETPILNSCSAMCSRLSVLIVLSASVRACCYQRLAFDSASASSTYAKRSGTLGFGAQAAIQPGIGYWCSSGAHYPGQVVTWTGLLDARRTVAGMSVAWEYHPGEWKILASQDGSNFEELQQWQYTDRNEMKFEHTVMFPNPIVVRAITLVMRSARPWQYFGLTRLTLLAAPGPVMIVSGVTADAGELCLAAVGGRSVSLRPCLQTIAIGDGTDIFQFSSKGQLENIGSHECVILNEELAFLFHVQGLLLCWSLCFKAWWQAPWDGRLRVHKLCGIVAASISTAS